MKKEKKETVNNKVDKNIKKSFSEKSKIKKAYYDTIIIFTCTIIMLLSSGIFLYNAYFNYTPPASFIVLNEDNRVLEDIPITEDYVSESELNNLVNNWIVEIFNYHYLNLDTHGAKIKDFFANDDAYSDFMSTFNGLRLQQRVRALNGIVLPRVIEPITLDDSSLYMNNRRIYQMRGIYVIEIRSSSGTEVQRFNVTVIVSRRSLTERPSGYGIESISIR